MKFKPAGRQVQDQVQGFQDQRGIHTAIHGADSELGSRNLSKERLSRLGG
jgi:hypothetical protein